MRFAAARTALAAFALTVGAAGAPLVTADPAAASGYEMTQGGSQSALSAAGIGWSSSGNCTSRSNSRCTSFDQLNSGTVDGVTTLREVAEAPLSHRSVLGLEPPESTESAGSRAFFEVVPQAQATGSLIAV
jgi:hypothetical protein